MKARAKLALCELAKREGDTVLLMNELKRIDSQKGELTKTEKRTARKLIERISHKAASREIEAMYGKRTTDSEYESERAEYLSTRTQRHKKSLIEKLSHTKEMREF